MAKPLKKLRKPNAPQTGPFFVTTGTPNSQGDPVPCKTETRARDVAVRAFEERKAWCAIYNKAGVEVMDAAIVKVRGLPIGLERKTVVAVADEYSGLTVQVWIWRK